MLLCRISLLSGVHGACFIALLASFLYRAALCSLWPEDGTSVFMAAPPKGVCQRVQQSNTSHPSGGTPSGIPLYPGERMDALALFVAF